MKAPNEMKIMNLTVLVMPNGEILCKGRSLGWIDGFGQYLHEETKATCLWEAVGNNGHYYASCTNGFRTLDDTWKNCPYCGKIIECTSKHEEDDGQPSELQENQDFAQDDDFYNSEPPI